MHCAQYTQTLDEDVMTTDHWSLKEVNKYCVLKGKGLTGEVQTILRNNFLYIAMVSHETVTRDNKAI